MKAPLTEALAEFVAGFSWDRLPQDAAAMTRTVVRDGAAALIAAANPDYSTGRLIADFVRDQGGAEVASVVPLAELAGHADIIVEWATAESFPEIARTALEAGKMLIAVSAGGVPNCPQMVELARRHGGRVHIASGALPGLDIIRCAAEGGIRRAHLASRIKPDSLAHESFVIERGHDFAHRPPAAPVKVFEGSAGEAAAAFPRHFNVAVSLSLAGIGFDRTTVEIWADPGIPGTIHRVEVDAEDVALTLESRNRPSANPRTSRIVAPSVLAAIRSLVAPVTVGS